MEFFFELMKNSNYHLVLAVGVWLLKKLRISRFCCHSNSPPPQSQPIVTRAYARAREGIRVNQHLLDGNKAFFITDIALPHNVICLRILTIYLSSIFCFQIFTPLVEERKLKRLTQTQDGRRSFQPLPYSLICPLVNQSSAVPTSSSWDLEYRVRQQIFSITLQAF